VKRPSPPSSTSLRVAFADLNGQPRGKRLPAEFEEKVADGGTRAPLSAGNLDVWGADIERSPLVFETGDADGVLLPTDRGRVAMPWLSEPTHLYPVSLYAEDGTPFDGDARHALVNCLDKYTTLGWQVMAATEVEFFLLHPADLTPARGASVAGTEDHDHILSLTALDGFASFFDDLYAGATQMGIPAQAAISESGGGQFEINLTHQSALRAADDCWLFKQLIKGTAQKHGLLASFAAKPFPDQAGNGLHVHFSIVDRTGKNIFDDGTELGHDTLRWAIAGCLGAMAESTLIFAPHAASYDRLVPNAHAPTGIAWAYENRTTALRVPGGHPAARRIEHRVAGVDANPYLLMTAVLGAALVGIADQKDAPPPVVGNAYDQDLPQIPTNWADAIRSFEQGPLIRKVFPQQLINNFLLTKHQEQQKVATSQADALSALYHSLI
jgi:glutamine synthetase